MVKFSSQTLQEFLRLVHPELVFFIKYEYWLNYLSELKKQNTPTYLISGIFRPNQMFFKWYGGFYRKALDTFTYFFVQNQNSKDLLLQLGKTNVSVSGDTRFDRVAAILEKDNAVADFRTLIGATNPAQAAEGTIRKNFAASIGENAVHGSDSDENAVIEGNFFFSNLERF